MKPGYNSPQPTFGTIEGAPNTQTPSQAEHGLEGVLLYSGDQGLT